MSFIPLDFWTLLKKSFIGLLVLSSKGQSHRWQANGHPRDSRGYCTYNHWWTFLLLVKLWGAKLIACASLFATLTLGPKLRPKIYYHHRVTNDPTHRECCHWSQTLWPWRMTWSSRSRQWRWKGTESCWTTWPSIWWVPLRSVTERLMPTFKVTFTTLYGEHWYLEAFIWKKDSHYFSFY